MSLQELPGVEYAADPTALPGNPLADLYAALAAAQAEMPAVEKTGRNPHFKSEFVTIDHLIARTRPVLNKHGLAIIQFPFTNLAGKPALRTTVTHAAGASLDSELELLLGSRVDMQALGAAITYARRYAWAAACGIASEADDDGESIAERPQEGRTGAATPSDVPAHGGNPTGAPTVSEPQLKMIHALMRELAEGDVASVEDLTAYVHKEYGVEHTSELTGGRGGQASELIGRLQKRLAAHLLTSYSEEERLEIIHGICGVDDLDLVKADQYKDLLKALKAAQA